MATPNYFKHFFLAGFIFIAFIIGACAPLQKTSTGETGNTTIPEPVDKTKAPTPISIYKILAMEAEKFVAQGNYQDALFVYNQAFSQADGQQQAELIPRIEALLSQTPSQDIEQFIQIPNISIPGSLLRYWLGWNLSYEENTVKAIQVLETFIQEYPDHRYFSDASELLKYLNKKSFQKDTIGCLLPLSGKYAIFGQQALAGIQLAVKEMSERYNKDFHLIIEDTKADPFEAVEAVKRLKQRNVSAIMGPLLAVKEAGIQAQELGIPLIALTQKEDFPEQGDFLFSNFITPQMQVQTIGSYLFGELGIQKVAILYPDEQYGQKYMNLFWDMAEEYGVKVAGAETYDGSKTDFTTALEKLTGKYYPLPEFLKSENDSNVSDTSNSLENPAEPVEEETNIRNRQSDEEPIEIDFQALFIPDSPSKVKLILPQLAFNDIKDIYLVGTNLWHHESLLKKDLGRYNRNAIITDGYFNRSVNPETVYFAKKFKDLFDQEPKFLQAISYDTACLLFATAMNENIDSRQQFKAALQVGQIYEGATGMTVFDNKGHAHRRLFLMTIKNNQFVEINH